jgi:hypothetical protein
LIDESTLESSVLPAILLAQAATLLGRAREIDLSLDQQCVFVVAVQICLFPVLAEPLAAIISGVGLFAILLGRMAFARKFQVNTMIVSIAVGLMLVGLAFTFLWLGGFPSQYPRYHLHTSMRTLALLGLALFLLVLVIDRFVALNYRMTVPVQPIGSVPGLGLSVVGALFPAVVLTTMAGSLLALHAGTLTLYFSDGFGVLGATAALFTYGRLIRASGVGLMLGATYVAGVYAMDLGTDVIQSFLVPIFSLAVMAAVALIVSRP